MKKIVLATIPLFIILFSFRYMNTHSVTGSVSNERGKALPNVTVSEKGTKHSVQTDANGKFTILVSSNNATIIFTSIGYTHVEVQVNKRSEVYVVMKASNRELDEVVVIGTGNAHKRDIAFGQSAPYVGIAGRIGGNAGYKENYNTEEYDPISENAFHKVSDEPLSTFSIDVDAASYSNVRRYLNSGGLPPAGAVRTEELINYFKYDYPAPTGKHPFSITTEMSVCPWNNQHQLVMIGLQGKKIPTEDLPPSNLVFLIDVSGSMQRAERLPLVKSSLNLLVDQLREQDKISIVVYAGATGLVLPATSGSEKKKIKEALEALEAGGPTAGSAGINLAYKVAKEQFMKNGNNRVILCTDGDFNVGVSSNDDLVRIIEKERESGVFLTVLGYGMGNYKDSKMQQLADKGNGNHAYIDGISEAKKVLVNEFGGTLFTIAKDVKLQVEFNPAKVAGYRLIGYENRLLKKEDFKNDKKDAGELGSGHTVTALYEIIPAGVKSAFLKNVDPLKYQSQKNNTGVTINDLLTVKFRYKATDKDESEFIVHTVAAEQKAFGQASTDFRFAASVAGFSQVLRNSEFKGTATYTDVLRMAKGAIGSDVEGYRKEFLELIKKAAELSKVDGKDVVVNE